MTEQTTPEPTLAELELREQLFDAMDGNLRPSRRRELLAAYRAEVLAAVPVGQAPATDQTAPVDWIDGHPQLEAIASAVWERCRTEDTSLVVDDPRNIAVAALAAVLPASIDRAAVLREAADECDKAGAAYTARAQNEHAAGAFALMETFLRKADEAEYVATPCDFAACEPGGEPCSTHERLMAHAEGDHELCAPDCGVAVSAVVVRRATDETPGQAVCGCGHGRAYHDFEYGGPRCRLCPERGEWKWAHAFTAAVGAQQPTETRP